MVIAEDTLTATGGGTEDTLVGANATASNFVLLVDRSNMESGDEIEIRVAVKVLAAGAEQTLLREVFQMHDISLEEDPVLITIPFPSRHSFSAYLTQITGTPRDFDWAVWQL